jgi:TonB family protein
MSAHIQQAGLFSGRHMTFMVVVGLHAVVISALIAVRIVPDLIKPDPVMKVIPILPDKPPAIVPPDPKPSLVADKVVPLDLPEVPVFERINVVEQTSIQVQERSAVPDDTGMTTVPAQPWATPRTATELKFQIVRPTDDYYPDASVRMEERGTAIVRVCVDAAGRIDGRPTIQTSSGYRRLDQAALLWASESLRFTPATADGVAIAACKGFRVNFTLR